MDTETLVQFAGTIDPERILYGLLSTPVDKLTHLMVGAHNVDHNEVFDEVQAENVPEDEQCADFDTVCQEWKEKGLDDHWVQRLLYNREEERKQCVGLNPATGLPKYPKYNPNYFDDYCKDYVLCDVNYDQNCMPVDAIGFDAKQTRQLEAFIIGVPTYIIYILFGLLVTPMVACGYLKNWGPNWLDTCSLGVIKSS